MESPLGLNQSNNHEINDTWLRTSLPAYSNSVATYVGYTNCCAGYFHLNTVCTGK